MDGAGEFQKYAHRTLKDKLPRPGPINGTSSYFISPLARRVYLCIVNSFFKCDGWRILIILYIKIAANYHLRESMRSQRNINLLTLRGLMLVS